MPLKNNVIARESMEIKMLLLLEWLRGKSERYLKGANYPYCTDLIKPDVCGNCNFIGGCSSGGGGVKGGEYLLRVPTEVVCT